ncbi:MAG: ACT domain-containing protein, partial [Evtepia sp.]
HVESGVAKSGNQKHSVSGVMVEGMSGCMVKFAKCCTPVPGDEITGFITRGYGVSVHRTDCPNVAISRHKPEEKDRWIAVTWDADSQNTYKTALELTAKDRNDLALDVAMVLSAAKLRVLSLVANSVPDGYAKISALLEVKDRADVVTVMNKLNQISDVYEVRRVSG